MSLTKIKRLRKLGNAVRALKGASALERGAARLPQKAAAIRVARWSERCRTEPHALEAA